MVDTVDFDSLTDDEFNKLSEEDFLGGDAASENGEENPNGNDSAEAAGSETAAEVPEGGEIENTPDPENPTETGDAGEASGQTAETGEDPSGSENPEDPANPEDPTGSENPKPEDPSAAGKPAAAEAPEQGKETKAGEADGGSEVKPKEGQKAESPSAGMKPEEIDNAVSFFKQITTPFKADGKDFTVRSPQDAIRLMQQGVNYARRMQELKPMRQMSKMLQDHDLADPEKLSYLIDLNRGDKAAIQKLLKEKQIDPLDLDISQESGYQATNYAGNPQDITFQDVLDDAIKLPEGQALIGDIHRNWDSESKNALRDQPDLVPHLVEQQRSGVYEQVVEELKYQRAMGYLTSVPFLQAYQQVGQAMQNAGVLKTSSMQTNPQPGMGPMSAESAPHSPAAQPANPQPQPQAQPLASGVRKAQPPKKVEPNPHLSSTPSHAPGSNPQKQQPDFDKMSDEDFLKMAPPA